MKGFKEGKCKCGKRYEYIGEDLGLCVDCIDKLESLQTNTEKSKLN